MIENTKTDHQPQVLYIMGTARSGTTVLEILLSANDTVCSVGELTHIFRDGFEGDNTCACGASFTNCVFWKKVQQQLSYPPSKVLQSCALFNKIDWHKGFLKILFHAVSKENMSVYMQTNKDLYNACSDISGKRVIVDSSKYPARALMLNKIYGPSVKIICLTRSPAGLMNAFLKTGVEQPSKSPFEVLVYYVYVLLSSRIVALISKNVLCITFEELTGAPIQTLKKIERFTGISFEQARQKIQENTAFSPGHIITGNRLRYNKAVFFQKKQPKPTLIRKRHNLFLFLMKASKKLLRF